MAKRVLLLVALLHAAALRTAGAQSISLDCKLPSLRPACLVSLYVETMLALTKAEKDAETSFPDSALSKPLVVQAKAFYVGRARLRAYRSAITEFETYASARDTSVAGSARKVAVALRLFVSTDSLFLEELRDIIDGKTKGAALAEALADQKFLKSNNAELLGTVTELVASVAMLEGTSRLRMTVREREAIVSQIDSGFGGGGLPRSELAKGRWAQMGNLIRTILTDARWTLERSP